MTLKEKFLKIESYDDFDIIREEYKDLDWNDKEVSDHYIELLNKVDTYPFPPISEGLMIDFVMDDE